MSWSSSRRPKGAGGIVFTLRCLGIIASLAMAPASARAADHFTAQDGDFIAKDFRFADGEALPELRLHYETLGTPQRNAAGRVTNAVLLLHGTTGTGRNFLASTLAEPLFGAGKPLDAGRYYLIMPDGIGAGGSTKPSDGLKSHFPHYGYVDQVEAQYRLLTEALHIEHLVLVLGTSMGGMQAWLWSQRHPDTMDGTVAIAATPAPITGRNMIWRQMIIDAIRSDPGWQGGDYTAQPTTWRRILPLFTLMTGNAEHLGQQAPTREAAKVLDDRIVADGAKIDAGDYLASFESSADYDPSRDLDKIKAPLLAINFADDLLNPPELGLTEAAMRHVAHGTAVLLPASAGTYGHQTLAHAEIWGSALDAFLRSLATRGETGSAQAP